MKKFQEFPKWMWGPEGQSKIVQTPEDVPEGWVDGPGQLKTEKQTQSSQRKVASTKSGNKPQADNKTPKTKAPTSFPEGKLTEEEIKASLEPRKMSELWTMAKELGLEKTGKKPELVSRITAKLLESQNTTPSE